MKNSEKFWDKQAKNFVSDDNIESKKLIEKTKKYLKKTDIVLDFACGTGSSSYELSKEVKSVFGLDYSKEMIRLANINYHQYDNLNFTATTIEDKQFEVNTFDIITAFNVLHLIDDLDLLTKRIHDLLKPNALFISYTPFIGDKKNIMSRLIYIASKLNILPSVKIYTRNELETGLTANGFTKIESIIEGEKIPNVYLVLKKS